MLVYMRPSNEALLIFQLFHRETGKPSFTARIERAQFYREGSASKKDGCLFPHTALAVLGWSSACTRSSTKSFRSVW